MKRIILILILSSVNLYSQGFDWQFTYREPSNSPRLFVGINAQTEFSVHNGDINFSESLIPCCRFDKGNGVNFIGGINSEYWLTGGEFALNAFLNYKSLSSNFTANPDPVYYKNDTLRTEIKFSNSISYIQFALGGKYRIDLSHFYVGAGLRFDILLDNNFEHTERVTSVNHSFNDGSTSRKINSGKIDDLSNLIVNPEIKVGYDFNLGLGLYASPNVAMSFNLNEIADRTNWKAFNFALNISIFKGIK